ncbi:hypothetical protein Q5424_01220 [Conexibacter sp. JD483]|uniref:hypothetical protein n=1 Tax=unclassified Conexibacter TaxID=2627773 RepID=UPI002728FA79|nr:MULTISPECIES: hypothetical protein [unclassified Conexibacter]MDO8185849.1 hypothetical protein [Conexibacter sp. CPCC 205706]MDO8198593.1 hypothetical protein [Conexibacter sp. CPCC 205762]MDR9367679.1 hypothetical protein [Conexibacter sp. JD483]
MTAALAAAHSPRTSAPAGEDTPTIWLPRVDRTSVTPGSVVMSAPSARLPLAVVAEPLPRERFADRAARAERELRAGNGTTFSGRLDDFHAVAVWDPRTRIVRPDDAAALSMLGRWLDPDGISQLELRRQLRASRSHSGEEPVVTALPSRRRGGPCR